jgi:hypothetical protein
MKITNFWVAVEPAQLTSSLFQNHAICSSHLIAFLILALSVFLDLPLPFFQPP